MPATPVHVTLACSAARFFVLLTSLLVGQILVSWRQKITGLVIALSVAYVIAITANSARVIFAWFAGRWAEHVLPSHFAAAVHMGAGIMVFLGFLVVTWVLFMKIIDTNERRTVMNAPSDYPRRLAGLCVWINGLIIITFAIYFLFYFGLGTLFLVATIRKLHTWKRAGVTVQVPAVRFQFGLWLTFILTGIVLMQGVGLGIGMLVVFAAQLLPCVGTGERVLPNT